jgi:predicted aconitase with swiveling domain
VAEKVKMGAVAGGGGSTGAVAVMPSTNGSTVADSVVASLKFDGAVLQTSTAMLTLARIVRCTSFCHGAFKYQCCAALQG